MMTVFLWPENFRIVKEVEPPVVVCENVVGIIQLALDTVLSDLESAGYTTETFSIPAVGKNALHKRERIWIIAYNESISELRYNAEQEERSLSQFGEGVGTANVSNSGSIGSDQSLTWEQSKLSYKDGQNWKAISNSDNQGQQRQETQQEEQNYRGRREPLRNDWWEVEPRVGRVADGFPGRVDRLKGLGNAIVPQVAYEIFCAIDKQLNF